MEVDELSKNKPTDTNKDDDMHISVGNENVVCEDMLSHLSNNRLAHFKSQQVGEPELSPQQKRAIAKEVLLKSPEQFLSRFGNHLKLQHLEYFSDEKYDTYEIKFHLQQLRRSLCREKKQVDIRNRRYQALKKLLDEGTYFSETEMMKRNPLLYEQLVGQFLSRKEIRERDKCDENAKTFLTVLMDQLDREEIEKLKQQQKDDEEAAVEEVDTSDEESEAGDESLNAKNEENLQKNEDSGGGDGGGGGGGDDEDDDDDDSNRSQSDRESIDDNEENENTHKQKKLSRKERELLREEFITSMYHSFLEGRDKDFDYSSQVDGNPDYECLAVRTQDEEEKYFDAESPEILSGDEENMSHSQQIGDDEEDELDVFMKNLKPDPTPSDLATEMEKM